MTGNGLIHKIAVLGSADPRKFLRRFPKGEHVESNYQIEHTPHELAKVISVARAHRVPPRRVLSVGSRTMGAERVIVENIGALEFDWVAPAPPSGVAFQENLAALKEAGVVVREQMTGEYDLVLLAGDHPIIPERILAHVRVGSVVAVLGIGMAMGWPNLRRTWFWFRNHQYPMMQTGPDFGEVGVGMVEIRSVAAAVRESDAKQKAPREDTNWSPEEDKPAAPKTPRKAPEKASKPAAKKASKANPKPKACGKKK